MGPRVCTLHSQNEEQKIFDTQIIIYVVNRSTVYILNHLSQAVLEILGGGVTEAKILLN